jgi:putative ABC transport system substrate-binding protein
VKRRLLLSAIAKGAGAALLLSCVPLTAAQYGRKVIRLGLVGASSSATAPKTLSAFWDRLRELGYVEGDNLIVERRWADGQLSRLPALMDDVVARKVDLIFTGGTPAAVAAKKSTSRIPIVVSAMGDPLGTGLVASLANPGGNLTGLSLEMTEDISGKWLQLLQEAVPRLSTVAVVANPDSTLIPQVAKHLEAAARARGVKLRFIDVRDPVALAGAFKEARREAGAALVVPDPLITEHRTQITALAATNRLPTIYTLLEFMEAGGLMAYGVDMRLLYRRAAEYVDKILKGANPGDLPIEQATQYRLVVNMRAAKALGLTLPQSLLQRADEVMR